MNESVESTLSALEADKHIDPSNHYATREEALEAALEDLGGEIKGLDLQPAT